MEVVFVKDYPNQDMAGLLSQLESNQIILFENLRFNPGETKNDKVFARELIKPFDCYVNDAFGTLHRSHASVTGVTEFIPLENRGAGFLVQRECQQLGDILHNSQNPFSVVLGGAKVSDKISVILSMLERCNHLLIGGAMAYTFLA